MRRSVQVGFVLIISVVLAIATAEILARVYSPAGYYVWPPHFRRTMRLSPGLTSDKPGWTNLTINSLGIRGDPFRSDQKYRLLAVGGSTTICTYLDDTDTWTYQVQERVNRELGADTIWVGNVGRPGHSTVQHVPQVEKLLEQHREIDGVILLIGINDLLLRLSGLRDRKGAAPPSKPRPRARRMQRLESPERLKRAFSLFPSQEADSRWYSDTGLGRLWMSRTSHAPDLPVALPSQDERGAFVKKLRAYRKQASSFRHQLPDLTRPLSDYEWQVNAIIDAAEKLDRRVIFLTQPTIWRRGLSPEELDILWMGGPPLHQAKPGMEYYSVEALAAGMKMYNNRLLQVCRERGVECVDAAERLPKDTTVFWDDAHYTKHGAAMLADLLTEYLLAHEPLAGLRERADARLGTQP